MFFIAMLPIFPQLDPNGLHQPPAFHSSAKPSYDQLSHRKISFWTSSLKLALYYPPSGISIFNLKISAFPTVRITVCSGVAKELSARTGYWNSFLERLRPKSVPFSDLIRRSFFGKIDTITLNSFRLECEHLDDTNLYIAIGFYLLFETFRSVLRQKDNDRDNYSLIDSKTIRSFVLFLSNLTS